MQYKNNIREGVCYEFCYEGDAESATTTVKLKKNKQTESVQKY